MSDGTALMEFANSAYESTPGTVSESDLAQTVVDGGIDASAFDGVESVGNLIPPGTKCRFNLRSYKTGTIKPWQWAGKAAIPEAEGFGEQPFFSIRFVAQTEPWTGHNIFYFCPFLNQKTLSAAAAGDPNAIRVRKRLLGNSKSIMEGAEYKPSGQFNFVKFLDSSPDVGIEVRHGYRKEKDGSQGKKEEQVQSFVPLSKLR